MADFQSNPFAAWTPPRTGAQDIYERNRTASNLAGGRVPGGPAGLNDAGAYWRQVQGNELAGNRLSEGLAAGGSFLTGARARGQRFAQARRMRGSTAAAAAEQAGIDSYAPIALAESEAFGRAAAQNQDAFNQMRIAQERNLTDVETANIGASAQVASTQIRVGGDLIQQERDQRWRTTEREADQEFTRERRGWDVEDRDLDYGFRREERQANEDFARETLRDQFIREFFANNPDLWSDPTAFDGAMSFLDDIIGQGRPPRGGSGGGRPLGASPGGGRYGPSGRATPQIDPMGSTAGPADSAGNTPGVTPPTRGGRRGGPRPSWRERDPNRVRP